MQDGSGTLLARGDPLGSRKGLMHETKVRDQHLFGDGPTSGWVINPLTPALHGPPPPAVLHDLVPALTPWTSYPSPPQSEDVRPRNRRPLPHVSNDEGAVARR